MLPRGQPEATTTFPSLLRVCPPLRHGGTSFPHRAQRASPTLGPSPAPSESPVRHGAVADDPPPQSDTGQSPTIVHASLADNRPRKTRRRSSTQASPTFVPHYASVAPAFLVGFDGREPPLGSRGQRTSPTLGPSPALSESPVRHGASPAFVHASPADDRPRKSRKRSSMQASQTVVYATFANSDQNKPHSCSFNWY